MNTYTPSQPTQSDQRSLGDLFSELSQNAGLLVRQELKLANVEMKQKVSKAGKEVGLIVAGAFLGNAALLALVAALITGLANVMALWLAALLVGVVLAIIAAVLAVTGIQALRQMNPQPERTLATIEEDKEWLKQQIS